MTSELSILALYGLLIVIVLLLEVLLAIPELGLPYLVSPRDESREATGTGGRTRRAALNCVYGMALFAPAVLILAVQNAFTATTLLAAQAFLIARVIYVVVYLTGIPWIRTLSWTVSLLATAWLYILAL